MHLPILPEISKVIRHVNFAFAYQQAFGERNYHIFYEMLCGLTDEQKLKFNLTDAQDFTYLNQVFRFDFVNYTYSTF